MKNVLYYKYLSVSSRTVGTMVTLLKGIMDMNGLEMQREAIIEIVGTQYESRQKHHKNLQLQQELILKRQSHNPHDKNAVLVLTADGKELGFLPKGYASLYAPAMDSGRYQFTAEIVKAVSDPVRPILLVKITAEYQQLSEQEVEKRIRELVQRIINGYTLQKTAYLAFITCETVATDALVACLHQTRLLYQLYAITEALSDEALAASDAAAAQPLTTEQLLQDVRDLRTDINEILKKLQKEYDDCDDIGDEDEFWRMQREIRERRKRFRRLQQFCEDCCAAVETYVPAVPEKPTTESTEVRIVTSPSVPQPEVTPAAAPPEQLSSVAEPETPSAGRTVQRPELPQDMTVQAVDFNNPQECAFYKPTAFSFKGRKFTINSWKGVYTHFLKLLYSDARYTNVLTSRIGKSLYGRCSDFADSSRVHQLRRPVRIAEDFYAEVNLSAPDIVKHIRYLMELCAIDADSVRIEYIAPVSVRRGADEVAAADHPEQPPAHAEQPENDNATGSASESISLPQAVPPADHTFQPDRTKPFDLKEAVTALLASDDPRITRYREHKNGLTSKALQELLIKHYDMAVSMFDISRLLMTDAAFRSVGWGCYVLSPEQPAVTDEAETNAPEQPQTDSVDDAEPEQDSLTSDSTLEERIIAVILQNKDSLQYEDGFGAYEVKNLLANEGITGISEDETEAVMAASDKLREVEDGYYVYDDSPDIIAADVPSAGHLNVPAAEEAVPDPVIIPESTVPAESRRIILRLNGNIVRAYDYTDALCKICEFAINCRPFQMARIDGQMPETDGKKVFCRQAVPVDGYRNLSNGLQVMAVYDYGALITIAHLLMLYCQMDVDMIQFLSK